MVGPFFKVLIEFRINPVFILIDRYLAVVWCDVRSNATKIFNGIIVYSDPVFNVTFHHCLGIEIVTIAKCGDKDCNLCNL